MPSDEFSQTRREEKLLRHIGDVVVELRPDGRITFVSQAVERILGRPVSYFVGMSFLEAIIPDDRLSTLATFRKLVDTGDDATLRFRCDHADGHRVEFEANARAYMDEQGQQRLVAVCRDRTEQSLQGVTDRTREAHHRAIAESATRAAVIVTSDGEIQFSNRRFREVFGNCSTVLEIRERVSESCRASMDTAWYQASQDEQVTSGSGDFDYVHDDGSISWFSSTWEASRLEDSTRQLTILYQEITLRKKVEQALRTIAEGLSSEGTGSFQPIVEMIAQAIEMDRIVLGLVSEHDPANLELLVAWQDGVFLDDETYALENLPDQDVANGEICIHPTAIGQLMPAVPDRIGHDFDSYAGLPLLRTDGSVLGIIGGYGRKPIHDTDLVRSVLTSFAMLAAAAIDRLRSNEVAQANRARFDALASQTHDMLVEIDAEGFIAYMSPASLAILGRKPEFFIGQPADFLVHPDNRPVAESGLDELEGSRTTDYAVTRGRHADGSWRWIESRATSFKASDHSDRTLVLARDVTERRRGELGRELLFSVVQHGADLVFVCQQDTTLLIANEAATRLLAPSSEGGAVEGRRFSELLSEVDALRLESEILPGINFESPWSGELELRGSFTEDVPIAAEATVYLFQGTEDTDATYLAITLRDITQRRSVEEALRQSELRLRQAQRMEAVGRLAGGIAHDFNNLLTTIIGYSDLVLDELGEGHGSKRDVEEILRAAERAGGLTRQLLAFSRRQVVQPESVDLNVIVADIDRMMRRLIGENIELVTVQDGGLHRVIADPGQIEQVIVNLVVNARDAMPTGGRIEVETANFHNSQPMTTNTGRLESGDYVLLRVSDNGIGMDEAVCSRLFEPFFTTKEAHEGTGLGLASAYGIVSQAGGQIDVESAPNLGTTLSVYLPASEAQDAEMGNEAEEAAMRGSETVLVVEDSEPVRTLVARTLEKSGYTVLTAESATAALRHCSRHPGPIDVLLTDVILPKTSGPEIARRVHELRPTIRVLFMSGFTDDTLIRHGLRPGRPVLLEKPFTPSTVLSRVRGILDADPEELENSMFPVEHSE